MRDQADIEDSKQFFAPVPNNGISLLRRDPRQDDSCCQQSAADMQYQMCGAQDAREPAGVSLVQERSGNSSDRRILNAKRAQECAR